MVPLAVRVEEAFRVMSVASRVIEVACMRMLPSVWAITIDGPPGPDNVDLLLRPRDVTLTVDPDGIAVVQSRIFHGAEFTYRVQLPCGVVLQSNQPSHVDISPGTRVSVRCGGMPSELPSR